MKFLEIEGKIKLLFIFYYVINNGYMFYLICNFLEERLRLIDKLKKKDIYVVFYYLSLYISEYNLKYNNGIELIWLDYYVDRLLWLFLYFELMNDDVIKICNELIDE